MAGDRREIVCDKGCGSRQRQATAWKQKDRKRQSLHAAATVKASGEKRNPAQENKWQVSSLSIPFTCILIISKRKISNTVRLERWRNAVLEGDGNQLAHEKDERFVMFAYAKKQKNEFAEYAFASLISYFALLNGVWSRCELDNKFKVYTVDCTHC